MRKLFTKCSPFLNRHIGLEILLTGFFLTIITEAMNRRSVSGSVYFLLHSPHTFSCNVLIVSLTLCVSLFSGKWRGLIHALISLVWLVLGTCNFVILGYRMTPFSAEDIKLAKLAMQISRNYLTPITAAAIVLGIVLLFVLVILLIRKFPREKQRRSLVSVTGVTAVIGGMLYLFVQTGMKTQALSENFENLAEAYEDYGFAYCFSNSIVDVGISKPSDYNLETMEAIADQIREKNGTVTQLNISEGKFTASDKDTAQTPDIIMIQLESFFDPSYMKGYSFSEDPVPFFRSLRDHYPSGFLTVPVVGAGTANTEFETLTGMSTDYFGAGEYPYNTVLGSSTSESLANILRGYDYTSTVLHNHRGTFYKRNNVFSQLGFDRFVPKEYLYDIETTPMGWAKDAVLTDAVMDCLDLSEGPDFIYTITVQSHGRYPAEKKLENPLITVSCDQENVNVNPVEYYVNQLKEVDNMIQALTQRLEERGENAVLVLFGDHLPAFGYNSDDLTLPSLYTTEYVIWSNFDTGMQDQDLEVETLGSSLLRALDMKAGIIPQFHAAFDNTDAYQDALKLLEYDMLYGEGYIFRFFSDSAAQNDMQDEEVPCRLYPSSELGFGIRPITVSHCDIIDGEFYVYGDGFNEASRIVMDGKIRSTTYVDHSTLILNATAPEGEIDQLMVMQCDPDDEPMGAGSNVLLEVNAD